MEQQGEGSMNSLSFLKLQHPFSPALGHLSSWFSVLRTLGLTPAAPGSQASGLRLNYTTSFPGSPACRRQAEGLLSFCHRVSQHL